MYEPLALYIGGQFLGAEGRAVEEVRNPATGAVLDMLPHATTTDLDAAVESARDALVEWRSRPPYDRAALLRKAASLLRERADSIAQTMTMEQGKPLSEARGEVMVSADIFDWNAEEARRIYGRVVPGRIAGVRQTVLKEPVGVCALFTPWNFPALTPARKVAAALAAGCTAVLKAAEETPGTAVAIIRALHDAGVPHGVINLVFGKPADISSHLIARPEVRKISFTGSTSVGKHLLRLAADGVKRTTMELGGNAPVIVCEDADLRSTVQSCVSAKFRNAGQVCIAPSRFFVHESLYENFVREFAEQASHIRVGNGLDEGVQMGPPANQRRMEEMEQLVENAIAQGGRVVTGGRRLQNVGDYFAPTVIDGAGPDARLFTHETFGPIAPFAPFASMEEVLGRANGVEAGLAAYAFTRSIDTARMLIGGLEAGMVGMNGFAVSTPETPFGGVKESGHGQEGGIEGLDAYLNVKLVSES